MLETEKIIAHTEGTASDSGDFGMLYDKVSTQLDTLKKDKEDPISSSSGSDYSSSDDSSDSTDDASSDDASSAGDETPDDFSDDSVEEAPPEMPEELKKEDPKEDKPEKEEKDKEATEAAIIFAPISLESLELEFTKTSSNISLEEEKSTFGRNILEAMRTVGAAAYAVGTALAYVGVKFGIPLLKAMYKVVIYLGAKFIRFTFNSIKQLEKDIERFKNRTSSLKEDLTKAQEVVTVLKEKKKEFPNTSSDKVYGKFDRVKIINRIKIGDVSSPIENTKALSKFLEKWYSKTNRDFLKDSAVISQVLHYGVEAALNPVKVFGDTSMRHGLIPDPRIVHEARNGFVDSLKYPDVLPGDMSYCCVLPNGKSQTIDDVRQAYAASECSFAIEPKTFRRVEEIDYMELENIEVALTGLQGLIKSLEEQIAIFETIKKEKTSYLTSFKRYFLKLADSDKKINLEQSMMEYIYLRNAYIDRVYTVTARDIHDFTQRYIANVMTYLRSNLEELSS